MARSVAFAFHRLILLLSGLLLTTTAAPVHGQDLRFDDAAICTSEKWSSRFISLVGDFMNMASASKDATRNIRQLHANSEPSHSFLRALNNHRSLKNLFKTKRKGHKKLKKKKNKKRDCRCQYPDENYYNTYMDPCELPLSSPGSKSKNGRALNFISKQKFEKSVIVDAPLCYHQLQVCQVHLRASRRMERVEMSKQSFPDVAWK
jgi:hypothetical protein